MGLHTKNNGGCWLLGCQPQGNRERARLRLDGDRYSVAFELRFSQTLRPTASHTPPKKIPQTFSLAKARARSAKRLRRRNGCSAKAKASQNSAKKNVSSAACPFMKKHVFGTPRETDTQRTIAKRKQTDAQSRSADKPRHHCARGGCSLSANAMSAGFSPLRNPLKSVTPH